MYSPKFSISNKVLKNVGQIEASKEVIENAPLVPSYEKSFQSDAIVRTVYHGTHIEGNDLTMTQTRDVLEGKEVTARERDIQEVINYRDAVKMVDQLVHKRGAYNVSILNELHGAVVKNVVEAERVGKLRNTQVVIKEEGTGKVIFTPPPYVEVEYLLEDFFEWLSSTEAAEVHPVIRAGIVHYVLVAIHPYVEGNGRTARAFSTMVMLKEGYDIKKFFAIEEHFDRNLKEYYDAFFEVDMQATDISARDLTPWLEYFSGALAAELSKIKEKVRKLSLDSRLRLKIGQQVALSGRQMKLIEYLGENGMGVMKDLREVLPMVSEDTILRDLKDLTNKGIIEKEGRTKAARYVIKMKGGRSAIN